MDFILIALLAFAVAYIVYSQNRQNKINSSLKIKEFSLSNIVGFVILTSNQPKDREIQDVLAYKTVKMISERDKSIDRYIWLICDSNFNDLNSSYQVSLQLKELFEKDKIAIKIEDIKDINDPEKVFSKIEDIFQSANQNLQLKENQIVCDCTGGSKIMSLGMTLASMGGRRLVYYSRADKYIEFDTQFLFDSVLEGLD